MLQDLWKLGKWGQIPVNRHFVSADFLRDKGYAFLIDRSVLYQKSQKWESKKPGELRKWASESTIEEKPCSIADVRYSRKKKESECREVWNGNCYRQRYTNVLYRILGLKMAAMGQDTQNSWWHPDGSKFLEWGLSHSWCVDDDCQLRIIDSNVIPDIWHFWRMKKFEFR